MAGKEHVVLLLGWLLLAGSWAGAMGAQEESEFVLPEPEEYIRSEGGRVEVYSERSWRLQEASLAAARITIEENSMSLPMYSNTHMLKYVTQGRALAGLVSPMGIAGNLKHIEKGDILAVPKGWTIWIWNNNTEQLRIVGVARTTPKATETRQHRSRPFHIIGGKEEFSGGVINGFSKDLLARAWDVERDDVEELLQSQKNTGFVKVKAEDAERLNWQQSSPVFGDFVFRSRWADPEIYSREGGSAMVVNGQKLPILRELDLSACWAHLKQGALFAPHSINGAQVMHFTRGKGHIEIVRHDGRNALRREVKGGDTIVVPAHYPHAVMAADDDELEWVSISNTHFEVPAFLAGYNSLYHALPREVLKQGLNVKDELLDKFYSTRRSRQEVGIFPPHREQVDGNVETWFKSAEEVIKAFEKFAKP